MALTDSYGRRINYMRLSVTDRCNLRCGYCMPAGGVPAGRREDILSYEEFERLAAAAVGIGIEKVRVTGGEPLVRKGIVPFLARLAAIPGLKQLVLTTNGILLREMALPLRDAGVQRLNISLDSLRPEVFSRITRCGELSAVLEGIDAAERAGLPVKLNAVLMRGVNDDELLDLAALTERRPLTVRFIEYMPVIKEPGWQEKVVPGSEIIRRIGERFPLTPLERGDTAGPAREYRIAGAAGCIGVIAPLSHHFCQECNRIRVTSAGIARSCLFCDTGIDLRPHLTCDGRDRLMKVLRSVVAIKPGNHDLTLDENRHEAFTMAAVGG